MPKGFDVLLDLDGTLIDPQRGIVGSILYALNKMGHPIPPSAAELVSAIGPPLRATFSRFLGEDQAETALTHYREHYRDGAMFDCEVYAGIPETLSRLAGDGHRLIIVTSKPHVFARPIAEKLGLATHVAGIYGPELDGTRDDKRELLAYVLHSEGIAPERAVMVGDRKFDMLAGVANRVFGVGVTWGYGNAQELSDAGAGLLCHAPLELAGAVETLRRGRNQPS